MKGGATLPKYTPNASTRHLTISKADDSTPATAANWNPGIEALADNEAYDFAHLGHTQAIGWGEEFAASAGFLGPGTDFAGAAAYGPLSGRWALAAIDNGTPAWAVYGGNGLDAGNPLAWDAFTGPPAPAFPVIDMAITEDPSTADVWIVFVVTGTDNGSAAVYPWTGPAWGTGLTLGVTGNVRGIEATTLGAYAIVAIAVDTAGSKGGTQLQSSNNRWTGPTTTTTFTAGLPVMPAGSSWCLKSNGTSVLAIPYKGGFGASTNVWKTTDGHTWTNVATLAFLAASDNVVGLAWDPLLELWVLALQTTTPTVYFYTSPDGVAWTSAGTAPTTHLSVTDMAAVDGALVCALAEVSSGGKSGTIWSGDGGATWWPGKAELALNEQASFSGYTRPRIAASDQGSLLWNNYYARFSKLTGFPAASL
ncbi:MAG TPA: hypothetical protein VHS09_11045 [Polyangiaceae bacterium]|jgi:hypothetical protein|nr:hypothetical protein [Polyangiaceae bacterium]